MPVVTHDGEDDPFPTEGEEAPAVRVRDVFSGFFHHNHDYNHEYSQGCVPSIYFLINSCVLISSVHDNREGMLLRK